MASTSAAENEQQQREPEAETAPAAATTADTADTAMATATDAPADRQSNDNNAGGGGGGDDGIANAASAADAPKAGVDDAMQVDAEQTAGKNTQQQERGKGSGVALAAAGNLRENAQAAPRAVPPSKAIDHRAPPSFEEMRDPKRMAERFRQAKEEAVRIQEAAARERQERQRLEQEVAQYRAREEQEKQAKLAREQQERAQYRQRAEELLKTFAQHADMNSPRIKPLCDLVKQKLDSNPKEAVTTLQPMFELAVKASAKSHAESSNGLALATRARALQEHDDNYFKEIHRDLVNMYAAESKLASTPQQPLATRATRASASPRPAPPPPPAHSSFATQNAPLPAGENLPAPAPMQSGAPLAVAGDKRSRDHDAGDAPPAERTPSLRKQWNALRHELGRVPTYDEVGMGVNYVEKTKIRAHADGSTTPYRVRVAQHARETPEPFGMREWNPEVYNRLRQRLAARSGRDAVLYKQ